MLRFMKGGYSLKELITLDDIFNRLETHFENCDIDCDECGFKHLCQDISLMRKYLDELIWKK